MIETAKSKEMRFWLVFETLALIGLIVMTFLIWWGPKVAVLMFFAYFFLFFAALNLLVRGWKYTEDTLFGGGFLLALSLPGALTAFGAILLFSNKMEWGGTALAAGSILLVIGLAQGGKQLNEVRRKHLAVLIRARKKALRRKKRKKESNEELRTRLRRNEAEVIQNALVKIEREKVGVPQDDGGAGGPGHAREP